MTIHHSAARSKQEKSWASNEKAFEGEPVAIMTLRQYSKHRGVALSSVQKAIRTGRIRTLVDGNVDSEQTDAEWEKNTMVYAPAVTSEADDGVFGARQYTKARAVREHYQALLSKIEFEEATGKLLSRDEVHVAAFNKYRQFRDAMLNIPDRVAAVVAAETDPRKCFDILKTEINGALIAFADGNN
jgi:hypothetical protein